MFLITDCSRHEDYDWSGIVVSDAIGPVYSADDCEGACRCASYCDYWTFVMPWSVCYLKQGTNPGQIAHDPGFVVVGKGDCGSSDRCPAAAEATRAFCLIYHKDVHMFSGKELCKPIFRVISALALNALDPQKPQSYKDVQMSTTLVSFNLPFSILRVLQVAPFTQA